MIRKKSTDKLKLAFMNQEQHPSFNLQQVLARIKSNMESDLSLALSSPQLKLEQQITSKEFQQIDKIKSFQQNEGVKRLTFQNFVELNQKQDKEKSQEIEEEDLKTIAFLTNQFSEVFQMTPFDTETAAVLRAIKAYKNPQEKGKILEMATGEGKSSVIIPILLAHLYINENNPIHIHQVNPYLAERDYQQFLKFAQKLGIADEVGLIKNHQDEELKKKIVFGLWSNFVHAYQTKFLGMENSVYPDQEPILILDEIDQLLQDESLTPAVISEKRTKKEVVNNILNDLKQVTEENNHGKERRLRFRLPFGEKQQVELNLDEWPLPENEEQLRELMSLMTDYAQELLELSGINKISRPKEETINYLNNTFDFYFFLKEIQRKTAIPKFDEEQIKQLRKLFDDIEPEKGIIFPWSDPDLQRALFSALVLKEGEDYFPNLYTRADGGIFIKSISKFFDQQQTIIKSPTTGYSEEEKEFESVVTLFLALKHNLIWPNSLTDTTLDKLEVTNFYQRQKKIIGFTGTASPIARELFAIYQLSTQIVPKHFMDNRTEEIREAKDFNDKKEQLRKTLLKEYKNTIIIVDSDEEVRTFVKEFNITLSLYNTKVLSAANENQDSNYFHWVSQGSENDKSRLLICVKMAGRGVDLKPDEQTKKEGLRLVLLTPFLSQRDWLQLIGRVGRRGEKGEVITILAPDDQVFLSLPESERKKILENPKNLSQWLKKAWKKREENTLGQIQAKENYLEVVNSLRDWLEGKNELYFYLRESQKNKIKEYLRNNWYGVCWVLENDYNIFSALQSTGPFGQGNTKPIWINFALKKVERLMRKHNEKLKKSNKKNKNK